MKGYKTSKDYKRLKELLDKGYRVVCFDRYDYALTAYKDENREYRFTYGGWRASIVLLAHCSLSGFVNNCHGLEFIEPEEE